MFGVRGWDGIICLNTYFVYLFRLLMLFWRFVVTTATLLACNEINETLF